MDENPEIPQVSNPSSKDNPNATPFRAKNDPPTRTSDVPGSRTENLIQYLTRGLSLIKAHANRNANRAANPICTIEKRNEKRVLTESKAGLHQNKELRLNSGGVLLACDASPRSPWTTLWVQKCETGGWPLGSQVHPNSYLQKHNQPIQLHKTKTPARIRTAGDIRRRS